MSEARKLASNPPGVAKPIRGYYSNSVRVSAGPLLFIAGQVSLDSGGVWSARVTSAPKTVQVLENIQTLLRANDADMQDVVSVKVYVTDIGFLDRITGIRLQYFPANGSASAIVEIAKLAMPELLIEIAAVAAVP
jgi:enamine deaminase RidA (YjgF/YER057c/UK114 family)